MIFTQYIRNLPFVVNFDFVMSAKRHRYIKEVHIGKIDYILNDKVIIEW